MFRYVLEEKEIKSNNPFLSSPFVSISLPSFHSLLAYSSFHFLSFTFILFLHSVPFTLFSFLSTFLSFLPLLPSFFAFLLYFSVFLVAITFLIAFVPLLQTYTICVYFNQPLISLSGCSHVSGRTKRACCL